MMIITPVQWARAVLGPLQFRSAPGAGQFAAISTGLGVAVYTPRFAIYMRRMMAWIDQSDPLVAAGGATKITWNLVGGGALSVAIVQDNITFYNQTTTLAVAPGAGVTSPTVVGELEQVLHPTGFLIGNTSAARSLNVVTDAGTATGTLYFSFEWRPLSGIGATP